MALQDVEINLLCSYLSGRSQFSEYTGSRSEILLIDTGVP